VWRRRRRRILTDSSPCTNFSVYTPNKKKIARKKAQRALEFRIKHIT